MNMAPVRGRVVPKHTKHTGIVAPDATVYGHHWSTALGRTVNTAAGRAHSAPWRSGACWCQQRNRRPVCSSPRQTASMTKCDRLILVSEQTFTKSPSLQSSSLVSLPFSHWWFSRMRHRIHPVRQQARRRKLGCRSNAQWCSGRVAGGSSFKGRLTIDSVDDCSMSFSGTAVDSHPVRQPTANCLRS